MSSNNTLRPIQLILDFDGTLTKKDTLHVVAQAGYKRQKSTSHADKLPDWQDIVQAYITDFESHIREYHKPSSERKSILDEAAWLDSLKEVETVSAERVQTAGIFDGVTRQDMESAASEALVSGDIQLRPGWAELLIEAHKINKHSFTNNRFRGLLQLVSVNWSRWFVWSVMWKAAEYLEDQTVSSQVRDSLRCAEVYANEVVSIISEDPVSSIPAPGGQSVELRTAGDKLKQMQLSQSTEDVLSNPIKVYVGDSTTDLECLLMADIGICMRDHDMGGSQKDLASTCERVGVLVKKLNDYQPSDCSAATLEELTKSISDTPKTLYYVDDFHEIVRWLNRET